MIKGLVNIIGVFVLLVLVALLSLVGTGVLLGSANAWILEGTFSEAWHAVWDRWIISLLWALLFFGILGLKSR